MKHEETDSQIDEAQSLQTPRKRARATKSEGDTPSKSDQKSIYTPEQDARLLELYAQKVKLDDIHEIFVEKYGFEGTKSALKNRHFKVKAEHTVLTDEEKHILDTCIEELHVDKVKLVLDSFTKQSPGTKVTKAFVAKYIKEWEAEHLKNAGGKTST